MRSIATRQPLSSLKSAWTREAAWLEARYNNRELVPEHPSFLARWAQRSAQVRDAAARKRLDVAYGATPAQRLDVFPARREQAPVLVFIHGGYWRALDKSDHSFVAPAFTDAGVHVVIPNYSLCPKVRIADIALEMTQALAWTWRHATEFGGDPTRIVVAGHSAGGHLAAMMLACEWALVGEDLPPTLARSAIALSGLFDLEPIRHTPFLQADLQLDDDQVARVSPAGFAPPSGRLRALVGEQESDEFLRQTQLIEAAWGADRVPVCAAVPGCHHFSILDELARVGSSTHRVALNAITSG